MARDNGAAPAPGFSPASPRRADPPPPFPNGAGGHGAFPADLVNNEVERLRSDNRQMAAEVTALNQFIFSRADWARASTGGGDPRRNVEDECGHSPLNVRLRAEDYKLYYDRDPVARRVFEVMARECWQVYPEVYEVEDEDVETPFERAVRLLPLQARDSKTYFSPADPAAGNPINEALQKADVYSGIGTYAVIFLGFDDVTTREDLAKPVAGVEESNAAERPAPTEGDPAPTAQEAAGPYRLVSNARWRPPAEGLVANQEGDDGAGRGKGVDEPKPGETRVKEKATRKLLFVRPLPETMARVHSWENNWSSPRYGQPLFYNVVLSDPYANAWDGASSAGSTQTLKVHWTRVIHVPSPNDGDSVMRPVQDRIFDLRKLYGGSAEMYWKGALPGLSFESHPNIPPSEVNFSDAELKDAVERYSNGLQRYLRAIGFAVKTLSPTVVDPTPQIERQLEAVCIQIGCPKRIFMGSERGELASSQDDQAWNDRLRERNTRRTGPLIVCPFYDRLIMVGVLPEPRGADDEGDEGGANSDDGAGQGRAEAGTVHCFWPDPESQTEETKTKVAQGKVAVIDTYVKDGLDAAIAPLDFWTKVYPGGMSIEEAEALIKNVEDHQEEKLESELDLEQEGREGREERGLPVPPMPGEEAAEGEEGAVDEDGAALDAALEPGEEETGADEEEDEEEKPKK